MLLGFIFKLFLFYLAYVTIRGLYRIYKTVQLMKSAQDQFKDQWQQKQGNSYNQDYGHANKTPKKENGNTIEAEYRVLDDNDK